MIAVLMAVALILEYFRQTQKEKDKQTSRVRDLAVAAMYEAKEMREQDQTKDEANRATKEKYDASAKKSKKSHRGKDRFYQDEMGEVYHAGFAHEDDGIPISMVRVSDGKKMPSAVWLYTIMTGLPVERPAGYLVKSRE